MQHFYNEQNAYSDVPNESTSKNDGPNESTSKNVSEFIQLKIKDEVKK